MDMRPGKLHWMLMFFFISASALAQEGHDIQLTLKPYKNSLVYLGYYYGKIKAVADSAMLDANSSTAFKGKEKLPGGIYFIVSPKKEILFEVLIDKQQNFSIAGDTNNLAGNLSFTGSPDNALFFAYTRSMAGYGKQINALQGELSSAKTKTDSTRILEKMKTLNLQVQ